MRHLRKYWLTVAVGLAVQTSAFAQTGTTGSGTTSSGSSSTGSTSTTTAAVATPVIGGVTTPATSGTGVDSSNILGGYYAAHTTKGARGPRTPRHPVASAKRCTAPVVRAMRFPAAVPGRLAPVQRHPGREIPLARPAIGLAAPQVWVATRVSAVPTARTTKVVS